MNTSPLPLLLSQQCEFVDDATNTRCPNGAFVYPLPFNGTDYQYCAFHTGWYIGLLVSGDILWSELLGKVVADE